MMNYKYISLIFLWPLLFSSYLCSQNIAGELNTAKISQMEHQDKKLEIWKEAIPRMNEEDLEFILDFPECFEPKVLKMVRTRYDKITKPEDGEEEYEEVEETLKDAVLRILREMDCSYDFDEDGDIHFEYQDADFYITVDDNNQFIEIWNCGWKRVNLNDTNAVSKLKQAISVANFMGDICINYSIYKDTNELAVNCGTRTLFFEHIPNAHQFLEYKMQQLYEKEHPNERVN